MLSLLAALPLLVPTHPSAPGAAPRDERSDAAGDVALDVEILRRLLVQAINDTGPQPEGVQRVHGLLPDGTTKVGGGTFTYTLGTTYFTNGFGQQPRASDARGFHLPDLGAVYQIDVVLPVVEVEPPREGESEDSAADDAWREMEREVRGANTGVSYNGLLGAVRTANAKRYAIDPAALDEVRDAVVTCIARHGARIEALRGDEDIVVALHVTAANLPVVYSNDDDEDDKTVAWLTGYAARAATPVHLVVKVPRKDMDEGVDAARRHATVHQY